MQELHLGSVPLDDLSGLAGMPLQALTLAPGRVSNLTPLQAMPLHALEISTNALHDLSPLCGMPLTRFICQYNEISDLSPLAGIPLQMVNISNNRISDLTPLRDAPLQQLRCSHNRIADLAPLSTLPLKELSCDDNRITDLSPLRNLALTSLDCQQNAIDTLEPLQQMPLEMLQCNANPLTDLSPLADLPIGVLSCQHCRIHSLRPLKSLPLHTLDCSANPITDLSPLLHLPLTTLAIGTIPCSIANRRVLRRLPLQHFACSLLDPHLPEVITGHPTLRTLNSHRPEYVASFLPALRLALSEFTHTPHRPPSPPVLLRQYAVSLGTTSCLAIPRAFSRREAEAFSRWQGGRLVCVETPDKLHAVNMYLQVILVDQPVRYHLGLVIDTAQQKIYWLSGMPYSWNNWFDTIIDPYLHAPGDPNFTANSTAKQGYWAIDTLPAPKYLLLEWDT